MGGENGLWITTVVTKDNFNKLLEIGNLINNYPIDVWVLY